jgi:DNA-binding CsgD family transcriptional regulator
VAFNAAMAPVLAGERGEGLGHVVRHVGEGLPWGRRLRSIGRVLTDPGLERRSLAAHCEAAGRLAARLGLEGAVRDALAHAYERWDGQGHPHGLAGDAAASLLAAAVDAGRFGRTEVDAVLTAAGQATRPARVPRPAGLTEREVDVLRLIARGHTNKAVAAGLGLSPKTVGHHVEHIYAKAGVTTRAGATLFAMEQGLLSP